MLPFEFFGSSRSQEFETSAGFRELGDASSETQITEFPRRHNVSATLRINLPRRRLLGIIYTSEASQIGLMAPPASRLLRLMALVAVLWVVYLTPWPGSGVLEPLKPTLLAVAFALPAQRLGVASWPLVIAFSLTFLSMASLPRTFKARAPAATLRADPGTSGESCFICGR